jgi:hypothetical protein
LPEKDDGDARVRAAESSLPSVDGVDVSVLAKDYSEAASRVLAAPRWKMLAADATGLILLFYLGFEAAGHLATIASPAQPSAIGIAAGLYIATVIAGGGFLYLMGGVVCVAPDAIDLTVPRQPSRLITTLDVARRGPHKWAVLAVGLSVFSVAFVALVDPSLNAVLGAARDSSYLVMSAVMLAAQELGYLAARALHGTRRRIGRPLPLDQVAAQLVVVAAQVQGYSKSPQTADQRSLRAEVNSLERAAHDAERFALPRAPRWDRNAQRAAAMDGLRLASVIRAHKMPLARALSAEDFAKIARSLTAGAGAWSQGDFNAMVLSAPEVTLPARSRAVIVRLAPAVTLIVLGIVLPLLPPLNATAQAAASARTSLLVSAVLALATGAVRVEDYISTAVLSK